MTAINQKETKKIKLTGNTLEVYAFADNGKMTLCDAFGNTIMINKSCINSGVDELTTADVTVLLSGLAEIVE